MTSFKWIFFHFLSLINIYNVFTQLGQRYENSIDEYDNRPVQTIELALFTDQNSDQMEMIFQHAIDEANKYLNEDLDEETIVQLAFTKAEVNYGDSFQAYKTLCQLFKKGVAGVFGPSSKNTASHLMTLCDSKDVPYVFSHMTENFSDGFNLYPQLEDMASAIHKVLVAYDWTSFIFLYESSEYLTVLNTLLSLYENNAPVITVLRYDIQMNGDYKPVLRRVRKSQDNKMVVVGSTETIPQFLKQAQQIGIIHEDYKYIIGNLDFHTFDLEEYKYSEANITSFRMFSPEDLLVRELMEKLDYETEDDSLRNGTCPITMEMALMYDGVQLFAETAKSTTYLPMQIDCTEITEGSQKEGTTFRNYMGALNLNARTLTGPISFEGKIRKGYKFDVIELMPSGIVSIGSWDEENNFTINRLPESTSKWDRLGNSLANQTFVILIAEKNEPYSSLVENAAKLEGVNQYEGYAVDLVRALAEKLGFNYTFDTSHGKNYGEYDQEKNETTGWMKEIMENRAHLAVSDISITADRQLVVDFSIQFMNLGIQILFLQPGEAPPSLFTFMDPFSKGVWAVIGISYLLISICFFVLGRLSPKEWDNPFPCVEEPTELINQFTVSNSIWFTTGAILQQGCEMELKALSVRTVAVFWWFFTLIMVSSYTANLAAFLTKESPTPLIENVQDLADNKNGISYGCKKEGATRNFFNHTQDPVYKKMNEYLKNHENLLAADNKMGMEWVNANKTYAFLMESTSIEYHTKRKCKLEKVGDALDEKGYGIAMPKNFPHRNLINDALIELQEQGKLAKMKNKWWNEVGANLCASKAPKSETEPLNMDNLSGVYVVMIVGSSIALLYAIISWIIFIINKAKSTKRPFKEVFMEELKFVTDFHAHTRIINDGTSDCAKSHGSSMNSLDERGSQMPE